MKKCVYLLIVAGLIPAFLSGCARTEVKSMSGQILVEKVAENLVFPEGPVWHPDDYLIFSDVHGYTIEKLENNGGTSVWFDEGLKTNGLIMSNDNQKIYACCYSEKSLLEIDPWTRRYRVLADRCDGRKFNNVNDAAIDKEGNVYFTDPLWGAGPDDIQGVYCYRPDGEIFLAAEVNHQPNGLVVSPDQKWLYVGRSGKHDILRFRLEGGGKLSEGDTWVQLENRAEPDGMTVDSQGYLFAAQAGNGKVCVISPEGEIVRLIQVVPRLTTNCEFQGDDESILYVTCGGRAEDRIGSVYRLVFPTE